MGYIPFNAQAINMVEGHYMPASVKAYNNEAFAYWQRSLYQRAVSKIGADVPDNWQGSRKDFLLYCLLRYGFVFVSDNDNLGYWFNPGSLNGFDFYYIPTDFILANPHAGEVGIDKQIFKIGIDGQLLKFMPDFRGIFDIIDYYAEKLAALDNAINTSIINSKFSFLLAAKNKATAEALKKVLDKINKGEPAVIIDKIVSDDAVSKDTPFQFVPFQKLHENYITDRQLIDFQTILNNYDAEIGIKTIPYQKAERFVTSEADARAEDSQARLVTAMECLNTSVASIKELYPDINLRFYIKNSEGGAADGNSENNIDRNV